VKGRDSIIHMGKDVRLIMKPWYGGTIIVVRV